MTTNESDFLHYLKTGDMELEGKYDIPSLKGIKLKNLDNAGLIGFNYATNPVNMQTRGNEFVHFFLPDSNLERVWNNLDYYEAVLRQYKAILQPDFSQYVGMPRAMQIWQHYRRMWVSAHYQRQGLKVIPTPDWSDEDSFEYCFDGMPQNSCLCISTVGCMQNPSVRARFKRGFQETLDRLNPSQLILYGKIDDDIREQVNGLPYKQIDSDMKRRIENHKTKL